MQQQNKTHAKSCKAIAAAAVIAVTSLTAPLPVVHAEDSIASLQAQYDKLEKQIAENQKKIDEKAQDQKEQKQVVSEIDSELDDLNSQINILNKKINLLDSEISTLSGNITSLDSEIGVLEDQISQTKVEIATSKVNIDKTYNKALDRLTKSYMAGSASELELLLGAKSLADVLTWEQYIQNATKYDTEIIASLEENITTLQTLQVSLDAAIEEVAVKKANAEEQKTDLQSKQVDMQISTDDLSVKKNTINTKRTEAYAMLKTMNKESKEYQLLNEQMREEEERIDAELNARLAQIASVQQVPETTTKAPETTTTTTTTAVAKTTTRKAADDGQSEPHKEEAAPSPESATTTATTTTKPAETMPASVGESANNRHMICPIQDKSAYVSGTYPYYQSGGVHHGVDIVVREIGKTLNHDIVAPLDGKVITIGYGHASCGNYMEIDHGDGLVTRYYHCNTILVSLEQTVKQGQVIAKVGDTGEVTGPHLHFEVLLNTTNGLIRQNPLDYISVP